MYDLARIRYVTEHYRDLQGLALLPFSLWLLAWSAYDLGWIRPTGWLAHEWLFVAVCLVVMFALSVAIGKLYEQAFGWISPSRGRRKTSAWDDLKEGFPLYIAYALSNSFLRMHGPR